LYQPIEGVRRLAGKTVTVSFWATAATSGLKLGVNIYQGFGSGGSPSTGAWVGNGQSVTVPQLTTWQRFSMTFVLPSAAGKTLGTNNNDATWLTFWYSSGATNNVTAGNIGVQSGTVYLWGVQLEIGSAATPLEKIESGEDLRRCQRVYQVGSMGVPSYASAGGVIFGYRVMLPVNMRAMPTVTPTWASQSNATGGFISLADNITGTAVYCYSTSTAAGATNVYGTYTASADL